MEQPFSPKKEIIIRGVIDIPIITKSTLVVSRQYIFLSREFVLFAISTMCGAPI